MASCNGKGFSHLAAVHLAMPLMPDDVIDLLLKFFFMLLLFLLRFASILVGRVECAVCLFSFSFPIT